MSDTNETFRWEIFPTEGIRTGTSIFVVGHGTPAKDDREALKVWVTPLPSQNRAQDSVELVLVPGANGEWSKEFTLMLPGDYRVTHGSETRVIHVSNQSYLAFGEEFGIFSSAVVLLVGGMLIWLIRSKRNVNAASAGST